MARIEVKVPDIGDFKNIPIIEILVKPGDKVKADQSLITLESDKATMDVPSPSAGVVGEIIAKIGDKVSMGSLVLMLDEQGAAARRTAARAGERGFQIVARDAALLARALDRCQVDPEFARKPANRGPRVNAREVLHHRLRLFRRWPCHC